jgi:N-acetylmuramoyl-L-alanine amidase
MLRAIRFIIILILIKILCVSCSYVGYGPPDREIEKLYRRADAIYNGLIAGKMKNSQYNWDNAIRKFENIVKDYPNSSFADDAQYKIGLCHIQKYKLFGEQSQKAIYAFNRLLQYYPESEFTDDALYWKGRLYFLEEDYKMAMREYEKLNQNYPRSELYVEALAQIEECQKRLGIKQKKVEKKPDEPVVVAKKTPGITAPEMEEINRSTQTEKEHDNIKSEPEIKEEPSEDLLEISTEKSEDYPHQESTASNEFPSDCVFIKDVRFHSGPEFTRVVVDLDGSTEYKAGKLENPTRLYFDFQNTILTDAKQTIPVNDGALEQIRVAQFDERTTRMVLDVGDMEDYKVSYIQNPDRIVVDIYAAQIAVTHESESQAPGQNKPIPLLKQLGLKVQTIVIDPGHGGKDPGTVSKYGSQEKFIVLDIARRLRDLLEKSGGYRVHLTRETDVFIPLEKRTSFANQKGADIFLSIHINSSPRPGARGIETYYLSLASDEEARATAALENASAGKTIKDLGNILNYILRGAKVEESRELARIIQSRLCYHTKATDRGIRRAPFIVLIGAKAPSVLVELGFMSNRQDEQLMLDSEYRDKLAKALMEAIQAYVDSIDKTS